MGTHIYPGRGLPLSQLIFTLNEELKRVACSPGYVRKMILILELKSGALICLHSFTSDDVSQLDWDLSAALATVREWKNSFVRVNRIPLDILSLIPIYLSSQGDLFRASFVCRHWRKTFLQQCTLWSRLSLPNSEAYVETLLERAKRTALEVIVSRIVPTNIITKLRPHAQQVAHLKLLNSYWKDIKTFSELFSGPLPLLRTLKINFGGPYHPHSVPVIVIPPSLPFFSGAFNLEKFVLRSEMRHFLSYFVFPTLTTLELFIWEEESFNVPDLFNFLKISPMLRSVKVGIIGEITLEDVPSGMVVVLPDVETFSLSVRNDSVTHVYNIAVHISCPRARYTSLVRERKDVDVLDGLEIFPTSVSWNTIIHQYTTNPIEEVAFGARSAWGEATPYSLAFRSSDTTAITLGFEISNLKSKTGTIVEQMDCEVFCQALRTIPDYNLLPHIKRLHIGYIATPLNDDLLRQMVNEVQRLFRSIGPLDELAIYSSNLRIFLATFHDPPESDSGPTLFPHVKTLTISHSSWSPDEEESIETIVKLAKSQHRLGIPFERVTVRADVLPETMAERLRRWVREVDYCVERWWW